MRRNERRVVKDNTGVPDEYKHHCLKAVGKLWKDWKSRVKTKWYDKYETDEQRLAITPNRVVAEQWKILVKYWGLPEVQEMCEVNKSSRADGGVAPHRTGRTSFAQKRKELKDKGQRTDRVNMFLNTRLIKTKNDEGEPIEVHDEEAAEYVDQLNFHLSALPEEDQDDDFREVIFTEVFKEDKHGRVRMYGTGVTPSQVSGNSKNPMTNERKTIEEMGKTIEEMGKEYQAKLENLQKSHESQLGDMKSKYDDMSNRLNFLMAHMGIQVNQNGSTSELQSSSPAENGGRRSTPTPVTGNSKYVQGSSLGLNQPCNILSWLDNNEVVAKGKVSAVDPSTRVHGHMLGPDCYRVEIEEALNPRAEFYRFQPEFSAMEDAVGSTIAWPIKYIAPRT